MTNRTPTAKQVRTGDFSYTPMSAPLVTTYTITDKATGHQADGTFTIEQVCALLDGLDRKYVERAIARGGEYQVRDDTGSLVTIRPAS